MLCAFPCHGSTLTLVACGLMAGKMVLLISQRALSTSHENCHFICDEFLTLSSLQLDHENAWLPSYGHSINAQLIMYAKRAKILGKTG